MMRVPPMKLIILFALLGYLEASSGLEVLNVTAADTLQKLQKDLKEERNGPTARKGISGMFGRMFSGTKKIIDPQADLDELAVLYQAMNYADIAALDYLRKNCRVGGLFDPDTDPALCGAYLPILVKDAESRLSALTSQYMFSDGFLKAPAEWPQHAFEIYNQLDSYGPSNNGTVYVAEKVLIKNAKDRADGKVEDLSMATPQYSPLAALWSPVEANSGSAAVTGTVISGANGYVTGTVISGPTGNMNGGNNNSTGNGGGSNGFNNTSNGNSNFNTLNSRSNSGGNGGFASSGCTGNNNCGFNGNGGFINTGNGGGHYNGNCNCNGSNINMANNSMSNNPMANGNVMPMVNGNVMPMVNGNVMPMVNGNVISTSPPMSNNPIVNGNVIGSAPMASGNVIGINPMVSGNSMSNDSLVSGNVTGTPIVNGNVIDTTNSMNGNIQGTPMMSGNVIGITPPMASGNVISTTPMVSGNVIGGVSGNVISDPSNNNSGVPPRYSNDSVNITNDLFSRQHMIPMILVPVSALPCGGGTSNAAIQAMTAKDVRPALSNISGIVSSDPQITANQSEAQCTYEASTSQAQPQPQPQPEAQAQAVQQPDTTATKVPLLSSPLSMITRLWTKSI